MNINSIKNNTKSSLRNLQNNTNTNTNTNNNSTSNKNISLFINLKDIKIPTSNFTTLI